MQSSKKFTQISCLILVSIFFVAILFYQRNIKGCFWWNCASERSFTIREILLPNTLFPSESKIGDLVKDRGILYADEYYQTTKWEGGSSFFIVMESVSEKRAFEIYNKEKAIKHFSPPDNLNGFEENNLSFQSEGTENFFLDCGLDLDKTICVYGSQYEEFYIYLKSTIDSKMTFEKFMMLVQYLDHKMIELLEL